ncbi:MAG: tetraacyldisaccharide 4'-kinase [Nitrospirae bacterium RBG_13_39_12]|nr:MAG: tetraacyldisaccharide 4'-kinase [Nitrospirae bacterium RBG_13_39_12]
MGKIPLGDNMTPFEFLYYLGYSIKMRHAIKNQKSLPHKVISIGNITLGGTGKTPATMAVAEEAKKRGFSPCILTRGYKGKADGPCFVSIGKGPILDEYQAGDEAILMAKKLKGIPVVKSKNRFDAGIFAIQNLKSNFFFILDDGFQHRSLFRDKDILLLDGKNPFGNRRLLPIGSLREPINCIGKADIIVITKTDKTISQNSEIRNQKSKIDSLIKEIKQYNTKARIFFAGHRPLKFTTTTGNTYPIDWAKDKKFFGFCGIGNPRSFRETLLSADMGLTGFKFFRDHHRYSPRDMRAITKDAESTGAEWIVTTEKDIMRLNGLDTQENLVVLEIEFTIEEGFYNEVFTFT